MANVARGVLLATSLALVGIGYGATEAGAETMTALYHEAGDCFGEATNALAQDQSTATCDLDQMMQDIGQEPEAYLLTFVVGVGSITLAAALFSTVQKTTSKVRLHRFSPPMR